MKKTRVIQNRRQVPKEKKKLIQNKNVFKSNILKGGALDIQDMNLVLLYNPV